MWGNVAGLLDGETWDYCSYYHRITRHIPTPRGIGRPAARTDKQINKHADNVWRTNEHAPPPPPPPREAEYSPHSHYQLEWLFRPDEAIRIDYWCQSRRRSRQPTGANTFDSDTMRNWMNEQTNKHTYNV